jgi:hypothetical protein
VSATGEPIGFDENIKPLFRERDRQSMLSNFDLWSYEGRFANERPDSRAPPKRLDAVRRRLARGAGRAVRGLDRGRQTRLGIRDRLLEEADAADLAVAVTDVSVEPPQRAANLVVGRASA